MAGSRKGAEGTVMASSLVVLVLWGYRKLIEPATVNPKANEPALRQIIGAEPRPANSAQFAVAFGFVYLSLSILAMGAPELASAFAVLVATGYVLTNGASVFTDVTNQVSKQTAPASSTRGSSPAPAQKAGR